MSESRILSRERIYQGRVFALDAVQLRERDGSVLERQVVVHGGSIVVLPVLEDGRIVMIRNDRFSVGRQLWELCAGTLEKGEEPIRCAARELIEETGYSAGHIEPLCGFYSCPGICTEYLHCFLATDLRHVGQHLDETESIEVHVVEAAQAIAMIQTGQITDAKTISALLYWRTFLCNRESAQ